MKSRLLRVVAKLSFLLCILSAGTAVAADECVLPPSGLVGWWRGEGAANDASGNNNNGTIAGGVSFAPGEVGQGFSFDPANGSVIIPDSPSLELTDQLTIEAWINPRSTNADRSIVAKVGPSSGDHGYQLLLSANLLIGQFNSLPQSWPGYRIQCALPVATGTWCHAAWTYDHSAMKLYWNGQPVATNEIGAHIIAVTGNRLRISGDDENHGYFDGLIDEASVYSRALSDTEIAAIYNAGSGGKCVAPYITAQPQSQIGYGGESVNFTVTAAGAAPLAYQWQKDASPVVGATGALLLLTNLQVTDAGNYSVVVTNLFGSATSSNAYLTVYPPAPTNPATHVVNSPDDASLRAAIALGGWIGFGFNGPITLTNTIPITTDVFLDGSGLDVTVSGGNAVRLFSVAPGVTFGVTNLTLANGTCVINTGNAGEPIAPPADGGAIYNTGGNVALVRCTVTNNSAVNLNIEGVARGGAIFSDQGTVSLIQTSVSNNLAISGGWGWAWPTVYTNRASGGAIYTSNGALTITGCTLSSNVCQALRWSYSYALAMGGAIAQASGSMAIENSLLASNQALGAVSSAGSSLASEGYGGALAVVGGSLTIQHCQFLANLAQGGNAIYHDRPGAAFGGAVYSAASLTAQDSAFVGNQTFAGANNSTLIETLSTNAYGGAIYNSGTAGLSSCSLYSNYVQGGSCGAARKVGAGGDAQGGGIFNAAQLGATNCTLALNSASGGAGSLGNPGSGPVPGTAGNAFGGGVFNGANATFVAMNLSIASNACSSSSGSAYTNGTATGFQIANTHGTLRLHNSLVAYSGTNANAYGTITDDGYNICSDGSAQLFSGTSYISTDPKLGPLGGYGGPTLCMALLAGSPAIDTGDPAHSPGTDQRGFIRPFGAWPDMGAYEYGSYQQILPGLSITLTPTNIVVSFPASPANVYCLQICSNLLNWTDLSTNGPFACSTNVIQAFGRQGFNSRYFRLQVE